ncbi:hypothetical protein [Haliangium sp.]
MEKKNKEKETKQKLTLTDEELRALTQAELEAVRGGNFANYQGSD